VEEPLFPRYLFVGATDEQSWAPVRSTVGLASLVRFGGQVAEVSARLIEGLRDAAEEPRAVRPLFKQGQKVRIVAGNYATLEAVFDMAEGEERATVLLNLLGRESRVRVGVGEIVNAD
jgi:transcriptional antiterminator RfaH